MPTRHEYRLDLTQYQVSNDELPSSFTLRNPTADDIDALGELMLDAYLGTIDYDGETLDDAQGEVKRIMAGEYGEFRPEHSWLCIEKDTLLSACLMSFWQVRQVPLISNVLTAARAKGRGLAKIVLARSLQSMQRAGYEAVHAFITEGNTPSERLHRRVGFAHLPYYHWRICPDSIRQQVLDFVIQLQQILTNNLVGVYLHGSLTFGCFNPHRSDIDLLVITEQLMSPAVKRTLAELLLATSNQPGPLEISFLARQQLQPWQHPTPFDFHYSEAWRDKTRSALNDGTWQTWQPNNATVSGDIDLAGHITVLNARGITLAGAAIADVFPPVPLADYRDSILNDVESGLTEIEQNPVYTILNTCRTLAWQHDGQIRSKDTGGIWALHQLPTEYHPIIREALHTYRSADPHTMGKFSVQALRAFAAFSQTKVSSQSSWVSGTQQQI